MRHHLPATVQVGPSVGFSLIMVRLVSREMRTVESKGIWKAVRRYCVRTIGRSCFVSICCWISANSLLNFSRSRPGSCPADHPMSDTLQLGHICAVSPFGPVAALRKTLSCNLQIIDHFSRLQAAGLLTRRHIFQSAGSKAAPWP